MPRAKLEVSHCCRFAILTCSKGEYFVVWSKPYARYMVNSGLENLVITPADAKKLYSQIDVSQLPDADKMVIPEVQTVIRNLNEAHCNIPDYELSMIMIAGALDFIESRNKATVN